MKNKYIQLLLEEIRKLESEVSNLKENQKVSFSFFKESFKQTQEITRLLHELEFVQVEDLKIQMNKLVQFLSESKKTESEITKQTEDDDNKDKVSDKDLQNENTEKEITPKLNNEKAASVAPIITESKETPKQEIIEEDLPNNLDVNLHSTTTKSLNDIQTSNHTILDTNKSISLNDRFLFQRELFDNDRQAMNDMMQKLQEFKSYHECEDYLKQNTHWNFKDEAVEKFLEMLKKSS